MLVKRKQADETYAAKAMIMLADSGFRFQPHLDPEIARDLYLMVMQKFAVGAIDAFIEKTFAGEHEFCKSGFLPIPAAIAAFLTEEEAKLRDKLASARRGDKRRMAIWNTLPDNLNNRQREEAIDRIIERMDAAEEVW